MTGLCDITWDKGLSSPTGDTPKLVILSQAVHYDIFKCGTESRHCGKRKKSKWTKLTNAEGHINLLQSLFSCVISCSVSRDRQELRRKSHPPFFIPTSARTKATLFFFGLFERTYTYLIRVQHSGSERRSLVRIYANSNTNLTDVFSPRYFIRRQHSLSVKLWVDDG